MFGFMNAAGMVKTLADVGRIATTPVTHIVVGSVTLEPREGNLGRTEGALGAMAYINALGLPNPGLAYYLEHLPQMRTIAQRAGKILRISIAGFSPQEYGELARALVPFGELEINLGCPNVYAEGRRKEIMSFDVDLFLEVAQQLHGCRRSLGERFWLKLSPYSNPGELQRVAGLIRNLVYKYNLPLGVITSNTFAGCHASDADGVPAINAKSADNTVISVGGGSGGDLFRAIAVGQVRQFVSAFRVDAVNVPVIGVGGVYEPWHVEEYVSAGACGVQLGSSYRIVGERIFSAVATGLPG